MDSFFKILQPVQGFVFSIPATAHPVAFSGHAVIVAAQDSPTPVFCSPLNPWARLSRHQNNFQHVWIYWIITPANDRSAAGRLYDVHCNFSSSFLEGSRQRPLLAGFPLHFKRDFTTLTCTVRLLNALTFLLFFLSSLSLCLSPPLS